LRRNGLIVYIINAAIFVLLEIAALSMLRNSGEAQRSWFAKGGQAVMGAVWGTSQAIGDYFSLRKANDALAVENHELREKIAELEAMIADSIRTAAVRADGAAGGFRYIPATIAKISNNKQHNYIIIRKGSEDGVREGAGLITGKGAIGVIDAVSSHYSFARSFRNHEMNISARLGRDGTVGPMSWDGHSSDGAILRGIPHHVEITPGDTVFTSGFSSIFPADIPLGTAEGARIVNGSTYEIKIRLFEDFGALRYVTVVDNMDREEMNGIEKE